MAKKTVYEVRGKRWFDKTYGNTYHTVEVTKYNSKGKEIYTQKSPITYGYGDSYTQTAEKIMYPKAKDSVEASRKWVNDRNKGKIDYYAVDVNRKRDL